MPVSRSTVGKKATELERSLRLQPNCEPGLYRSELMESFTTIQLSNGLVLPWATAKEMGYLPPNAKISDLS